MRIKINFALERQIRIPIEYNYHLYLALRRTLFAYLRRHEPGLLQSYKLDFPAMTFSQLLIPQRRVEYGFINIESHYLSMLVGSPEERFIEMLAAAVQDRGRFSIYRHQLGVSKIQILEEPYFSPVMKWKLLSPFVLARREKGRVSFARPGDADLSSLLAASLISRYGRLLKRRLGPDEISITLNQDYSRSHKNLTKLISVRNIHYKAIHCPFTLKAPMEIIRPAYAGGIGEKPHYGFGMIELANQGE